MPFDSLLPPVPTAILWPGLALAGLTCIVWILMYVERLSEMRAKRVHPQKVAVRREAATLLSNTRALDHYSNLFESPVLFYFAIGVIAVARLDTDLLVPLAWAFVGFRAIHAAVHIGYNKVMHRFYAFVAATLTLWAFIAMTALQLWLKS